VVENNRFSVNTLVLNLTLLVQEMKLPPLANVVKFDAGTLSDAFFD
jgi:hypothetical protein